jgi:hypothetical protein
MDTCNAHFACTRALRARTCTRSELIGSTFPAEPEKVETGGRLRVTAPTTHDVRAALALLAVRGTSQPSLIASSSARVRPRPGTPAGQPCISLAPDGERVRGEAGVSRRMRRAGRAAAACKPQRALQGRGEPLTLVAFEDAEQRRASRGCRASTVRSTWRAAGAIVRVSTSAGLTEQRRGARRAVFAGAPFFAYFLWQDKESERPRGRGAGRGSGQRMPRQRAAAPSLGAPSALAR